jgi:hypothetical protein
MSITNPALSLSRLNDLESKIRSKSVRTDDLEELDYFLNAIGAPPSFIKNSLLQNGFLGYSDYLSANSDQLMERNIVLGRVEGIILGVISVLKSYALKNDL